MIPLPADMSPDDVSQWLNNGVFLVRTRSGDVPCTWLGYEESRVVCARLSGGSLHVPHTDCVVHWPELGSMNATGYAIHAVRRSERQYRRAFNHRCITAWVPWGFRVALANGVTDQDRLCGFITVAKAAYLGTYPKDYDAAEELIANGALSVAVNRRLILAGDNRLEKRLLYLDGKLAANVTGGTLYPVAGDKEIAALVKMLGGRYDVTCFAA